MERITVFQLYTAQITDNNQFLLHAVIWVSVPSTHSHSQVQELSAVGNITRRLVSIGRFMLQDSHPITRCIYDIENQYLE